MNRNHAMMRGRLAELTEKRKVTRKKARMVCRQIAPMINPALEDITDMDIAGAAALMDDLVLHQAELFSIDGKIKELEESLYG